MAKRWTKAEEKALLDGVGAYGMAWLRRRTDPGYNWANAPQLRSVAAVYAKLGREHGSGGLTRGTFSLRQVIMYSGYSRGQIFRAQKALRQKWKRTGPRGTFLITDDQLEEILTWLQHDYWATCKRLYACAGCTTEKRPVYAVGLCCPCYYRYRRMCRRAGVPATVAGQRQILDSLSAEDCEQYGILVSEIRERVTRGIALAPEHVDFLEMMGDGHGR